MKIVILTLFPDELATVFNKGIMKRAQEQGAFQISFVNMRDFSENRYRNVDDYPFASRKGMLIKSDILYRAITSIEDYSKYRILYTCPKGAVYKQSHAIELSQSEGIIIIAGYYEGVDERLFSLFDITRVSMGDFVLSSGEYPALIIAESVVRLIPGVIKAESIWDDSHINGLLEAGQYTLPREFKGLEVPEVLLSGHHQRVNNWTRKASLYETLFRRIDMLNHFLPAAQDVRMMTDLLMEPPDSLCGVL